MIWKTATPPSTVELRKPYRGILTSIDENLMLSQIKKDLDKITSRIVSLEKRLGGQKCTEE